MKITTACLIACSLTSFVTFAAPTTYHTAVLANNPYVYYEFGEASGKTAIDASGNGYNGTYENSPTPGVSGVSGGGASDTAVTFAAASDQYLLAPASEESFGANLNTSSYEFVFKSTDMTDIQILTASANSGSTIAVQVWLNEDVNGDATVTPGGIRFFIRDSTGQSIEKGFVDTGLFDGNYH